MKMARVFEWDSQERRLILVLHYGRPPRPMWSAHRLGVSIGQNRVTGFYWGTIFFHWRSWGFGFYFPPNNRSIGSLEETAAERALRLYKVAKE